MVETSAVTKVIKMNGKQHKYVAVIIGDRELPVLNGAGELDLWPIETPHTDFDRDFDMLLGDQA